MSVDVKQLAANVERRTQRTFYEDGLDELVSAPMCLLLALFVFTPTFYRIYVVLIGAVLVFVASRERGAAKRRLSDRRTGYVRPARSGNGASRRTAIAWAAAAGLFSLVSSATDQRFPTLPPLQPLVIPIVFFVLGFLATVWKTGLNRYFVLALVPVIAAAVAWPIRSERWDDFGVVSLATGVALLLSGGWALRSYLRAHPVRSDA